MNIEVQRLIGDIQAMFDQSGDVSYGEDVTQRQHALQSAQLAESEGASPPLILASLLHDVGHMLHPDAALALAHSQDDAHESIGADWLSQYFVPEVSVPVGLHVQAKRYLCFSDPGYYDSLSDVSKVTLALQGGVFTEEEAHRFAARPHAQEAISLRRWDERAKLRTAHTQSLQHFLTLVPLCLKGV
ncbi:MAG: hypothetical protein RLY30_459 [Pseudomonadota bacterium]|jgi:phosphonate degradation associated HDIG domain protein